MIELVALGSKTSFYIAQALAISELGKSHCAELVEASETFDTQVALIEVHATTKRFHGQEVHDLSKDQRPRIHNHSSQKISCDENGRTGKSISSR